MALIKKAYIQKLVSEVLNTPEKWEEYNLSFIKTATIKKDKTDVDGFDIKSAIKAHPEHLFVKIFAIKKDEVNDNGDAFCETELKKAAKTFIGVPIFCNHQNDDIEKARGKCVHAWYDDAAGGIYIIAMVDKVVYPKLARGIKEGVINGTSMGAAVDVSCCSVCHTASSSADEYCDHVKNRKNKKFSGEIKCNYHNSPVKVEGYENECPICGCKKSEEKTHNYKEARIYEHNFGLKFIEDSFVVNQACHSCIVQEVFDIDGLTEKIASLKNSIVKLSSCEQNICSVEKLEKLAGKKELDYLNDAMEKIEKVAKSMMAQKQYVSMEYVSNLVEAMANVQGILDELIEMGYAQLPSPEVIMSDTSDISPTIAQTQPSTVPPIKTAPEKVSPSGVTQQTIGDIGSMTLPKSASEKKFSEKKEDFITTFGNLKKKIEVLSNSLDKYIDNIESNSKESRMTVKNSETQEIVKTAEHDTSVITEKQLGDAKFTGERMNSGPDVITEKQLDNPTALKDPNVTTSTSPQARLGSYDTITEKQLSSIASGYVTRWNDFPDVITEKQWTDTSRLIGSVLSESQENRITEKQLNDFLSQHSYKTWDIITEKQLKDKTGDLARWASSKSIVKAAMGAIADTIAFYGKTPQEIVTASNFINQSVKNFDKASYLTLINALPHKDNERFAEKTKYTYFSKVASTSVQTPTTVDSLIVGIADNLGGFSSDDMLSAIKVITASEKGMSQVEDLVKDKLSKDIQITTVNKTAELEKAVLELNRPEDGTYQIYADLKEIGAEPSDAPAKKAEFLKNIVKFAEKEINDPEIKTALVNVDIDEEKGYVVATLKDINSLTDEEKEAYAKMGDWMQDPKDAPASDDLDIIEPTDKELNSIEGEDEFNIQDAISEKTLGERKASRETLVKEAQMFGGQGGPALGAEIPGQGGTGAGAGAGATLPQPPPAGGELPVESFEQSDLATEAPEDETTEALEPTPPGTRCPVCTSNDVDVMGGEHRCNNCGSKYFTEIIYRITEYATITSDKNDGKNEDEEKPLGLEEEGFAIPPAGETTPEAETATTQASSNKMTKTSSIIVDRIGLVTKLDPKALKLASDVGIKLGSVSPLTGSTNTLKISNADFICLDSGVPYKVEYAFKKKNPKDAYARWSWNPDVAIECESCNRSKARFVKALSNFGMSEKDFDKLNTKEKGNTIVAMKTKGLLKNVKTAGKEDRSVVKFLKNKFAAVEEKSFPMEMCMQKLANRFGENAVALSGPCEGKPIYDCVCKALKKAGLYSNSISAKVADIWMEKEASTECVEDFVRLGFELKHASTICSAMKAKYAQFDDMLAEELETDIDTEDDGGIGDSDLDIDVETDPFGEGIENGETVTIELPLEIIEKIDRAIDIATGENPEEEAHHNVDIPDKEVPVSLDEGAAEQVDEVVDKVLDDELGTEPDIGEETKQEDTLAEEAPVDEISVDKTIEAPIEGITETPEMEGTEDKDMYIKDKKDGCHCECKNKNPGVMNKEETNEKVEKEGKDKEDEVTENKEKSEDEEKDCMANSMDNIEKEASRMRPGYIGSASKINLDLSGVIAVLKKQAKTPDLQNVQDTPEIGKYKDGKTMHGENAVTEDGPSIPDVGEKAKIGKETPPKSNKPEVPSGDAQIGGEKDNSALDDNKNNMTGGEQGAGISGAGHKSASVKQRLSDLAERIVQASEKKLAPKAPLEDDKDIQPLKGDSSIGGESKFTAEKVEAKDVKTENEGFMGKEKETFKDKPNDPKDQPSFPAGGGQMGNETLNPEKQEKDKGTVIAESNKKIVEEATKIAGKMLTAGRITVEELSKKITELSSYKLETLADIEKSLFTVKKGLTTVADGLESPVVISEDSKPPRPSMKEQLEGLFTLSKRNKTAQKIDSEYGRI